MMGLWFSGLLIGNQWVGGWWWLLGLCLVDCFSGVNEIMKSLKLEANELSLDMRIV